MNDQKKETAAAAAVALVRDGMLVGLGTGSTASIAVAMLGEKLKSGELRFSGVCTSSATEELAAQYDIPCTEPGAQRPDIYIDGADRITPRGEMIKGGGGALLREKMVAVNARRRIIVVDDSKWVEHLGAGFPLPVEIVRFGYDFLFETIRHVSGSSPKLRMAGANPYVTDEGHRILDCEFTDAIGDPSGLDDTLKSIPGVVETGLFIGLCDEVFVGTPSGVSHHAFQLHREFAP